MVFYGVVRPPRQHLGHLRPLVPVGRVRQEQDPLFVGHPLHLQDAGVEVVMPALPALLAEPALDELGDKGPALGAILFNKLSNQIILLFGPGFFLEESVLIVLRFLD